MIFDMQKNTKNGLETPTGRTPQNSTGNIDFHHFFPDFLCIENSSNSHQNTGIDNIAKLTGARVEVFHIKSSFLSLK